MQIELENLKKTYKTPDGSIAAVDGISLCIPENTIFGIIGKSGAGKSSLVRLVSLLERPDSGAVLYNGMRVDNLRQKELIRQRRKTGMIFQNFNLFSSRTAAQNIAYPLEICGTPKAVIKERVAEMLSLVSLEGRNDAPISTLSGGQKQRVAIARALAAQPDILFCDEATSALDPNTTHAILNLIAEIQKKMNLTVVMITHQMEVVRDACSSVAIIDNGRVVEQGAVNDIFTRPQSSVTKDFLSALSARRASGAESGGSSLSVVRWSEDGGKYILHFRKQSTNRPVISGLLRKFDIDVNIRAGGIQHLSSIGEDVGTMILDFSGSDEEIKKAIAYLEDNDVIVEEEK